MGTTALHVLKARLALAAGSDLVVSADGEIDVEDAIWIGARLGHRAPRAADDDRCSYWV